MIFTKEPMPHPRPVRKPTSKVVHLTDDQRRTLCGRKLSVEWRLQDDPNPTCKLCDAGVLSLHRLKRMAGV